jgi:hypothetical protein
MGKIAHPLKTKYYENETLSIRCCRLERFVLRRQFRLRSNMDGDQRAVNQLDSHCLFSGWNQTCRNCGIL